MDLSGVLSVPVLQRSCGVTWTTSSEVLVRIHTASRDDASSECPCPCPFCCCDLCAGRPLSTFHTPRGGSSQPIGWNPWWDVSETDLNLPLRWLCQCPLLYLFSPNLGRKHSASMSIFIYLKENSIMVAFHRKDPGSGSFVFCVKPRLTLVSASAHVSWQRYSRVTPERASCPSNSRH